MEQEIISTKTQLEDFISSSPIWADIQSELQAWLEDIRDQLENTNGQTGIRIMDRLGGNAESVRNLLALPQVLLETLNR